MYSRNSTFDGILPYSSHLLQIWMSYFLKVQFKEHWIKYHQFEIQLRPRKSPTIQSLYPTSDSIVRKKERFVGWALFELIRKLQDQSKHEALKYRNSEWHYRWSYDLLLFVGIWILILLCLFLRCGRRLCCVKFPVFLNQFFFDEFAKIECNEFVNGCIFRSPMR